jgi:hypothetical protein
MSASTGKTRLDLEAAGALAALRRARLRAERIALASGTFLVEAVDGKPVLVAPRKHIERLEDEDLVPEPRREGDGEG